MSRMRAHRLCCCRQRPWARGHSLEYTSADVCQKVADWLRASKDSDRMAEAPSAAGCAHASLPVSEGSGEARASFRSPAVRSGAAHIQGAPPLRGQSAGLLTPALPGGQFPAW